MGLSYIGSLTIGGLCPSVYASIGSVAVSVKANLDGATSLHASLVGSPPNLSAIVADATQIETDLSTAASLGLPSVSFTASDATTLIANISAMPGLLVTLNGLLSAAAGIYSFAWEGAGNALGAAVTSQLATQWPDGQPTSGSCTALVFGAVASISQTQLAAFLNGLSFSSGLIYGGKIGMSAMAPVVASATTQGSGQIAIQLAAAQALQASLSITPPTLAASASAVARFIANIQAQGAIAPPSAAISATAGIIANINATANLMAALGATLNRVDATLFTYLYTGAANGLGPALNTSLASTWGDGHTSTSGACSAVVLGATDTLSTTTMLGFFNGA